MTSSSLSDTTLLAIRNLLAGRIFWPRLPAPVDALFATQRQQELAWLARNGWPLLYVLLVLISGTGWMFFGNELVGADREWWLVGLGLMTSIMTIAIVLLQSPRLQAHYQKVIVLFGALSLAIPLIGTLALESERLMQANSYVCLLIINILVLALRLSLLHAAICGGSGIVLAVATASLLGLQPDWFMLVWFSCGSLLITLFLGAVLERQERISFLQSLLLRHESTERERLNTILSRHASEDPLTGLANRRHFNEALWREWERASRNGLTLSLLFIDVDHFKLFNDNHGHRAGDETLSAVAEALLSVVLRPADMAARYGGEEFVLLLPETSAQGASEVANRVLAAVDALAIPHASSPTAAHVTVSVGVATMQPQGGSAQTLLDRADAALYAAKHAGRHRIVVAENP
ncbi:MAG: diguanylate cyclase [Moraxellaceae bacterium]|nr:diguanylate cyclase [Moraxellaceae bacterium]